MDIWVVSTFLLLGIMLLWTFLYKFLCAHVFSFLLGIYLGVELLGYMTILYLTFWGIAELFFRVVGLWLFILWLQSYDFSFKLWSTIFLLLVFNCFLLLWKIYCNSYFFLQIATLFFFTSFFYFLNFSQEKKSPSGTRNIFTSMTITAFIRNFEQTMLQNRLV